MTPAEHIAKLKATVAALERNKPFAIAVKTIHAERVLRIFDKGIEGASYDGQNNEGRELWVADKNLRRSGGNKGKTGKSIKTNYFKSYYDLKQNQGFTSGRVNLRLTNDLQSDFANSQKTDGTGRPLVGKAIKVSDTVYIEALRRPQNVKKLDGLITKYGDFTKFTPEERTKFVTILQEEFNEMIQQPEQ